MTRADNLEVLGIDDQPAIVRIWEGAVRATHHFLSEEDIATFKTYVQHHLVGSMYLAGKRNQHGELTGFVGVKDGKIEALFIDPACFGQGIGKRLVQHAVADLGATRVDVNEQNQQACAFYQHMGFALCSRSSTDDNGNPFPILHLALASRPA